MHRSVCSEKQKRRRDVYLYARVCAAARVFNVYMKAQVRCFWSASLPAIPAAPISFLCTPHKNIIIIIYTLLLAPNGSTRRVCCARCVVFFDSGARARSNRGENKLQREVRATRASSASLALAAKLDATLEIKKIVNAVCMYTSERRTHTCACQLERWSWRETSHQANESPDLLSWRDKKFNYCTLRFVSMPRCKW